MLQFFYVEEVVVFFCCTCFLHTFAIRYDTIVEWSERKIQSKCVLLFLSFYFSVELNVILILIYTTNKTLRSLVFSTVFPPFSLLNRKMNKKNYFFPLSHSIFLTVHLTTFFISLKKSKKKEHLIFFLNIFSGVQSKLLVLWLLLLLHCKTTAISICWLIERSQDLFWLLC